MNTERIKIEVEYIDVDNYISECRSIIFLLNKTIKKMDRKIFIYAVLIVISCFNFVQRTEGAACRDLCGSVPVKYPFGTGPGCGDPRFQTYVRCVNQKLTLTTHSGSYQITNIDYDNHIILLADPLMSTCTNMQNSGSFGLDWSAPFKIHNDVFVLLGCSSSSSLFNAENPLCDTGSSHICSSLYSCSGITGLGISPNSPISTCCVYSPINLGPADELNLPKLQCSSYSSIYSFGDDPTNPKGWRYGVALQYSYSLYNSYFSTSCSDCEQSSGVCGYTGVSNSFICICKNGVNTTTNCYGQGYVWSGEASHRLWRLEHWVTAGIVLLVGSLFFLLKV